MTPPVGPAPFSAAAIAALVLSLLGCLGITAVLGFVLAIVGILRTSGGARRGRGLAIAALPVSLVTGAVSVVVIALAWSGIQSMEVAMRLPDVYGVEGKVSPAYLDEFRGVCTDSFNAEVTADQLSSWFDEVRSKHGALVELKGPGTTAPVPKTDRVRYVMNGKFVSGTQTVELIMRIVPPVSYKIDDIVIADSSPRPSH